MSSGTLRHVILSFCIVIGTQDDAGTRRREAIVVAVRYTSTIGVSKPARLLVNLDQREIGCIP